MLSGDVLASDEINAWFQEKFDANLDTSKFRQKTREQIREKLEGFTISVSNISEVTKSTLGKWAVDAISEDIEVCDHRDTISDTWSF